VRRSIAGLSFVIAALLLALAGGGWWLQRIAFDTARSADVATDVLRDDAIRLQLARAVSREAAGLVGLPLAEVRATVERAVLSDDPGVEDALATLVANSHARLIGARDEPVELSGEQLVQLVRDERSAAVAPVVLPIEEVTALSATRVALGWIVPIAAIAGGVALLIALIAHPRKTDAIFGLGAFCIVVAVLAVLLGYVVPTFAVPQLSDEIWAAAIPAVANHFFPFVVAVAAVLVVVGLVLMVGSANARRRKLWSAPVSVGRYADQHRWS